jgi:hypothetical protein
VDDEVVTIHSALKRCKDKTRLLDWIVEYSPTRASAHLGRMTVDAVLCEIDRTYPDQVFEYRHEVKRFTDPVATLGMPIMADMVLMTLPNGHDVGFAMLIRDDCLYEVIPSLSETTLNAMPKTTVH